MSSNKQPLLLFVRLKINANGYRLRLYPPPIALYVVRYALLSSEGILSLIPGKGGVMVRSAAEALQDALYELGGLNVNVSVGGREKVEVRVKPLL